MRRPLAARLVALSLLAACGSPSGAAPAAAPPPGGPLLDEEAYAGQEQVRPYVPFAVRAAALQTRLTGPPMPPEPVQAAPPGAREIHYPSEVGPLRAWTSRPPGTEGRRLPVVVYLHNDFGLRAEAWRNALPFVGAGYALVVPGLRGEDGAPGQRELLLGEVRDARAAVAWARAQPGHLPECVSVIGHSIGGGIAGLLALQPATGLLRAASVGGIYRAHTFHAWAQRPSLRGMVRFDPRLDGEVTARLLLPNLRELARPFISYAGRSDRWDLRYSELAARRARALGVPFEHVTVPGDHMSSVTGAVKDLIARLARSDQGRCAPR